MEMNFSSVDLLPCDLTHAIICERVLLVFLNMARANTRFKCAGSHTNFF